MEGCVFCKIVAGELSSDTVYEDADYLAFRDISPSAPVHLLLIPKKHVISNVGEAGDSHVEMLGKMMIIAGKVAEKEGISENFSVKTNTGKEAGQTVWHIHYHIKGGWDQENKS